MTALPPIALPALPAPEPPKPPLPLLVPPVGAPEPPEPEPDAPSSPSLAGALQAAIANVMTNEKATTERRKGRVPRGVFGSDMLLAALFTRGDAQKPALGSSGCTLNAGRRRSKVVSS
jgi:hypothetical protein